jgi:hypothetical protein
MRRINLGVRKFWVPASFVCLGVAVAGLEGVNSVGVLSLIGGCIIP